MIIYKGTPVMMSPFEEERILSTLPLFRDSVIEDILMKRYKEQRRQSNIGRDAWLD